MKKYVVNLDKDEKERLQRLTTKGKSGARKIRRARILLLAEEGYIDKEIARALGAAITNVERVRKRFVEEGLEAALSERPRPGATRKLEFHHTPSMLPGSTRPRSSSRWYAGSASGESASPTKRR